MLNEHLKKTDEITDATTIVVDFSKAMGEQTGYVPEGNYEVKFEQLKVIPSKTDNGTSHCFEFMARTVAPESFAGVLIKGWVDLPIGDPTSEAVQKAARAIATMFRSGVSNQKGMEAAEKIKTMDPRPIQVGTFKAMNYYIRTTTKDYKGSPQAKFRWFIARDEFEAQSGPIVVATSDRKQALDADLDLGTPSETPELAGGTVNDSPPPKVETAPPSGADDFLGDL